MYKTTFKKSGEYALYLSFHTTSPNTAIHCTGILCYLLYLFFFISGLFENKDQVDVVIKNNTPDIVSGI